MNLNSFRVVLISPQSGGNVGSIARLCRNFGIRQLIIVDPRFDPNDELMQKLAVGDAKEILREAKHVPHIKDALMDSQISIAFTGQNQRWHRPIQNWNHFLKKSSLDILSTAKVSLVFGREDSGLSSDELNFCQHAIYIPTHPQQPSLNLSHAVAVVLAQLYNLDFDINEKEIIPHFDQATTNDYERLIDIWRQILMETKINTKDGNLDRVLFHCRQAFLRANLNRREMGFAMMCFSKIQSAFKNKAQQ